MRAVTRVSAVAGCLAVLTGLVYVWTWRAPAVPSAPPDPAKIARAFAERAERVARAWEASGTAHAWRHGLAPLSDLTKLPYADNEIDTRLDAATISALVNGWFVMEAPPTTVPPSGTVTFADGSSLAVPLETAAEAYTDMAASRPLCAPSPAPGPGGPDATCTVLAITHAELVDGHLLTGRGEASVPMWRFTVTGLDRPVDRVAVAPSAMTAVPADLIAGIRDGGSDDVTPGFTGVHSLEAATGTDLTLRVFAGDCDRDIGPLVYEDASVVVVGAVDTRSYQPCDATLPLHRVAVTLAAPIGGRVVLDVVTGHALAVRNLS